jgi:hypothetical protein
VDGLLMGAMVDEETVGPDVGRRMSKSVVDLEQAFGGQIFIRQLSLL